MKLINKTITALSLTALFGTSFAGICPSAQDMRQLAKTYNNAYIVSGSHIYDVTTTNSINGWTSVAHHIKASNTKDAITTAYSLQYSEANNQPNQYKQNGYDVCDYTINGAGIQGGHILAIKPLAQ